MRLLKFKKNEKIVETEESRPFNFSEMSNEDFKVTEKDLISPTIIKETIPKDLTEGGYKINDYYVEVGGTGETVRYYRNLYVELVGGNTVAGMFDKLYNGNLGQGNLEVDIDVATHIIPVESSTELDRINKRIRGIQSDLYRKMPDEKRIKLNDELNDLRDQADRIRLNVEKAFRMCMQICISSTDLKAVKKMVSLLTLKLSGSQIYLRAADGKQLDALLNLLPIKDDATFIEHTYSYETSNLADMFMFGNGKVSHRSGIVWGVDHMGRPIMYDSWSKSLMNRNGVVTGTSGGGKTVSVCKLIHHDVLRGIRHAIICPKGDYRRYVEAMGCAYFDFGVKSDKRINFFDVDIEEPEDKKGEAVVNVESTISAASAIVFKMVRVYDPEILKGITKRKIEDAIRELYQLAKINKNPNSLYEESEDTHGDSFNLERPRKRMPQLSDLQKLIEKQGEDTNNISLKNVAEILKGFTQEHGTPERAIFDCQSNISIKDAPLFAFGLADLDKDIMQPIGIFVATKWLATKFSHKNRHLMKRVVVDEAQVIMADEETEKWLENEFRIVRFFNTSMFALTQGFEVFERSENGIGIIKNSPTKLYLKQNKYDKNTLIEKMDLTDSETTFLIEQAKEGVGILHLDREKTIMQVTLTPHEAYLFETEANKLEEKRIAYEIYKAQMEKRKAYN